MKNIVEINGLDFHYKRQSNLLSNLSLNLSNNNIHGLLGKNGEGKTTLLKLICGLLFPKKGEVKTLGFNRPGRRETGMLQEIFFIPEEIHIPSLSVETFEIVYAPFYPNFSSGAFYSNLNEFMLDTHIKDLEELSYGQRKKFLIAFALATNARLIIMDEPTNGLDIPSKRIFRKLVLAAKNEKTCILISTHQVLDLEDILTNIIIMEEHKIVFNQSSETITQKLLFNESESKINSDSAIYTERTTNGYSYISENKTGESNGRINIELLFNAIMEKRDIIKDILRK